tara:strand:+ start:312 stop:554 length:243 start_codon:yes stop_codon:yes gene_type:complete
MIKKIILLLAILGPFVTYYFLTLLLKFEKKKYPVLKLSVASLFLLLLALGFFRYYGGFSPETKYTPAKYEDGELVPPKNE